MKLAKSFEIVAGDRRRGFGFNAGHAAAGFHNQIHFNLVFVTKVVEDDRLFLPAGQSSINDRPIVADNL